MDGASTQRIDKWLWFARVVKTRSLATTLVSRGAVRVNRRKISKPSHPVAPGDILTLAIGGRIRILKVLAAGTRRGPAAQARQLHEDLSTPSPPANPATPASSEPED
jgi:ribosome-associated heat shock protein Hsp15